MELKNILQAGVDKKASDIHILPLSRPLFRIDGTLVPFKESPVLTAEDTKRIIFESLTPDEMDVFAEKLVLESAMIIPSVGNFRSSVFHQMHGVSAVYRIVPLHVPTFDAMELPPVLKSLLTLPFGLILVSGPTGSGKSTTLAALIDYINSYRVCKVTTIEDPIEFVHENKRSAIIQIQVGRDTHSYANALRASLRQDPNVIMLGELRDLETMRLSLTAAETGHLVLATLHSGSASLTINRFCDVFPTHERNQVRTLLAETLQAIVCQRLVKRISGGRVAAFEVMLATPAIRHYIQQDMPSSMDSTMQTSADKGMITFENCFQELVKKQIITSLVASNALNEVKIFVDKRDQKNT